MNNLQSDQAKALEEIVIKNRLEEELKKGFHWRSWFFQSARLFLILTSFFAFLYSMTNFLVSYCEKKIPLKDIEWIRGFFVFDFSKCGEGKEYTAPWGFLFILPAFLYSTKISVETVEEDLKEKIKKQLRAEKNNL